jgi:hypothetical protein
METRSFKGRKILVFLPLPPTENWQSSHTKLDLPNSITLLLQVQTAENKPASSQVSFIEIDSNL